MGESGGGQHPAPAAAIREFILARFPHAEISDDDDIFALGFINSLFALELVMFIEQQFALQIPNEELRRENFRSVGEMAQLVERLSTNSRGR